MGRKGGRKAEKLLGSGKDALLVHLGSRRLDAAIKDNYTRIRATWVVVRARARARETRERES